MPNKNDVPTNNNSNANQPVLMLAKIRTRTIKDFFCLNILI